MHLVYRDFETRDLRAFAGIVGHAFKDDTYTGNRFINACLLRHELLGYLKDQNYAKVAYGSDAPDAPQQPVGVLVARIGKSRAHVSVALHLALYTVVLTLTRPGRRYLAYTRGLHRTDARLLAGKRFDTELKLFVVRPEYQNEGVGHHLLTDFQEICKGHGVREYYLFTDSYCNVDYYLDRGFLLESISTYNFFHETPPTKYYLFTHEI